MKNLLLSLAVMLSALQLYPQSKSDMAILKQKCKAGFSVETLHPPATGKRSFYPAGIMLKFYSRVMSQQLSADCAFDLTCSRFSYRAIGRYGIVKGVLLTADRLTRCHKFISHETVPILFNNNTAKVIDEPEMY